MLYVIFFSHQPQEVGIFTLIFQIKQRHRRLSNLLVSGGARIEPRWIVATWSWKLKELLLEASSSNFPDLSPL